MAYYLIKKTYLKLFLLLTVNTIFTASYSQVPHNQTPYIVEECKIDLADNLYKIRGVICDGHFQYVTLNDSILFIYDKGFLLEKTTKSLNGQFMVSQKFSDNAKTAEFFYEKRNEDSIFYLIKKIIYHRSEHEGTTIGYYYGTEAINFKESFRNGKLHELYEWYYSDRLGIRGIFVDDIKDSIWSIWSEEGVLLFQFEYNQGRIWNVLSCNALDGSPITFGNIKNGTGTFIEYQYIAGAVYIESQSEYVDGIKNGRSLIYYIPNGQISKDYQYQDGHPHGPFVKYTPWNTISEKGSFKNGKLHGELIIYGATGKPLYKEQFIEGEKKNSHKIQHFKLETDELINNIRIINAFLTDLKSDTLGYEGYEKIFRKYCTPINPITGFPPSRLHVSMQGLDTMKVLVNSGFEYQIVPYLDATEALLKELRDVKLCFDPNRRFIKDPWPTEYYLIVFKDNYGKTIHIQYVFMHGNGIYNYAPHWDTPTHGDFNCPF